MQEMLSITKLSHIDFPSSWRRSYAIMSAIYALFLRGNAEPMLGVHFASCSMMQNFTFQRLLQTCTGLQELTLANNYVTDHDLASLSSCTTLTRLRLMHSEHLGNVCLAGLGNLTQLQSLDLEHCLKATDAGFHPLSRLTRLASLNLSSCMISPAGLQALSTLQQVTSLQLSEYRYRYLIKAGSVQRLLPCGTICTESPFFPLAGTDTKFQMSRMVSLDLSFSSELRDYGLAEVVQVVSLQDLSLAYCKNLTNAGWLALSSLTSLTSLDLRGCGSRERLRCWALIALRQMPHLHRLNMANAHWCPGAVTPLANMASITQLLLSGCICWTAGDLGAVCCMRRMRDLDLQGCGVLDGLWIQKFAAFSILQRLNVINCTHVSQQQLDQLNMDCPRLATIQS